MTSKNTLQELTDREYAYGFTTELEADAAPKGLSEDIIRLISKKKDEPEWLLEWRLKAYRHWLTMEEPHWQNVRYAPIDYQDIIYYSAPRSSGAAPKNLDEVDPEVRAMFDKLGISLREQERLSGIAVDAVVDSVSVATTFKAKLAELGVVFCSFSEAVREHPELVRKYLGTVVPTSDNFFAALNSAVFTDGSFCFVPKGVRCPMELSTYFRINAADTGQFERTLIIAEDGAYVSYLEGCVPGWEEISYGDQLQTVRDVAVGDVIMNADGEEAGVAKIMRRGYRGELIEVTPRSPGNRFHVTPEHPVLAIRRSAVSKGKRAGGRWADLDEDRFDSVEPDYVPAGELEAGDYIVYPINQVAVDDATLRDDFLRLLGTYVSEGCATMFNGGKAVEFAFGDHEEEFLAQTQELVMKLTGKRGSVTHDKKKHGTYFVVYSNELWDALVEHGGRYAHGKRLSKAVMDLPPHRQDLFLETYYKGDGSLTAEGSSARVRAVTVSRQLAFQLQELMSRQGIFAYINNRPAFDETMKDGRVVRHSERYQLFHAIPTRGRRAIRKGNAFLVPVREIHRQPYEGYVYNLETKTDPHSYLVKGFAVHNCTAPMRDKNQLHAAVVELVALDDAEIKYSTVQNWYPGDKEGKGGIYNFVTKRGKALGKRSKISWTQVETGSAITWKYPSVLLMGDDSVGEFYSVAVVNNFQQADTGTKMMHIGKNTSSTIVSKGISAGRGQNTYRGLVKIGKGAANARNYSQCDSLLIGDRCGAHTFPYIEAKHPFSQVEHEASTSKISEDQLFYCMSRGLSQEDAVGMIVNGFCKDVMKKLPMEFAVEAQKLLGVSLEGSVG